MTHDEMRMIRREYINYYLQDLLPFVRVQSFKRIRQFVRMAERVNWKEELQAYAGDWQS